MQRRRFVCLFVDRPQLCHCLCLCHRHCLCYCPSETTTLSKSPSKSSVGPYWVSIGHHRLILCGRVSVQDCTGRYLVVLSQYRACVPLIIYGIKNLRFGRVSLILNRLIERQSYSSLDECHKKIQQSLYHQHSRFASIIQVSRSLVILLVIVFVTGQFKQILYWFGLVGTYQSS